MVKLMVGARESWSVNRYNMLVYRGARLGPLHSFTT